ncbi:hypothetical protein [Saccharothrix sp. Mg75]|uniref:hypothetical protein n=1 Tax=Saccharothrix sp. Mg75 TaxID=3445357 RepID=UPI003EEAF6A4
MNHFRARRVGALTAALALGLTAAPAAWAANPAGVASVGSADFTKAGTRVVIEPLAACAVDGTTTARSEPVTRTGVRFGEGGSGCTTTVVDPAADRTTTSSEATGADFELSALVSAGGPRLRVARWRTTCAATDRGTEVGWGAEGLGGFAGLPEQVPNNHVHEVRKADGTVLARVTFGETVLPEPNDGSIAVTALRVRFTEASGVTGEVALGSAACSPTP